MRVFVATCARLGGRGNPRRISLGRRLCPSRDSSSMVGAEEEDDRHDEIAFEGGQLSNATVDG